MADIEADFDFLSEEHILQIPGISAIIKDKSDRILMFRHKKLDKWTIPVGKQEPGETREQALKREMYEELGIIISDLKFIGATEFESHYAVPLGYKYRSFNDN